VIGRVEGARDYEGIRVWALLRTAGRPKQFVRGTGGRKTPKGGNVGCLEDGEMTQETIRWTRGLVQKIGDPSKLEYSAGKGAK